MDCDALQDIKISLRYDGKDALNHEIDLNCPRRILKGFLKFSQQQLLSLLHKNIVNTLIIRKLRFTHAKQKLTALLLKQFLTSPLRTSCSRGSPQLYLAQYYNIFLREILTRKMK